MNYDEFKERLKQEIQAHFEKQITFVEGVVNKTNELLESLTIRFEDQMTAPTIYPQKIYEDYQEGMPFSQIAEGISASLMTASIEVPELIIENAQKSISFSLLNKEKNKQLLKDCPYREIHDLAAIPRWHISDGKSEASFVVNYNVMQHLRLTKEEVLDIAQKNTESADYFCKNMDDILKDIMIQDGIPEEIAEEFFPEGQLPIFVISNQNKFDGSCAVLSDSFMQSTAEKIGSEELYLLPSSRHEMLALNADGVDNPAILKTMVADVNSNPDVIRAEDFLSNSIYKYNAVTHSLSVCDSKGLFHDKGFQKENIKQTIGRGRA